MTRPRHLGLRHLALNVCKLEGMKRFYVEALGFTVAWEPDPDNVYLTSGGDNVALHRSATDAPRGPQALDHLGLLAASADDVDAWAAFLESRGVALDARPRTHRDGTRSIYFRDPDGNRVQIIWIPTIVAP